MKKSPLLDYWNDNFFTNSTLNISFLNIQEKLLNLNKPTNFFEFINLRNEINEILIEFFSEYLEWKSVEFIRAFSQWNKDSFNWSLEEKAELVKLLVQKNKVYLKSFSYCLNFWLLDNLLNADEISDLNNIIKSWIIEYFDELFVNFDINSLNHTEEINTLSSPNPLFWWILKDKLVPYSRLVNHSYISWPSLYLLNNPNLKRYLTSIKSFIATDNMSYEDWTDVEKFSLNTWSDNSSKIWLTSPIEDYVFPWICVEPELILFLKDNSLSPNSLEFENLSRKYFMNWFSMKKITINFVEPILESGEATFSWFIWKAFPNDLNLSKSEWNFIILKLDSMNWVLDNAEKWLHNLLWDWFVFDREKLKSELIKEVTFHEYGHSLFVKWHPNSMLEELKATLFYYLKILDENSVNEYSLDDIIKVVQFTIMDSIRNIQRMNNKTFEKYFILTKVILYFLFKSKLVSINSEWLKINANKTAFNSFLNTLRIELWFINSIYNRDLSNDELKKEEDDHLELIDQYILPIINEMYAIINK